MEVCAPLNRSSRAAENSALSEESMKKELELNDWTSVADLARALDMPAAHVIRYGFENWDRLLTVDEDVPFGKCAELGSRLGFVVRRRGKGG
jgi:hypothetical protein